MILDRDVLARNAVDVPQNAAADVEVIYQADPNATPMYITSPITAPSQDGGWTPDTGLGAAWSPSSSPAPYTPGGGGFDAGFSPGSPGGSPASPNYSPTSPAYSPTSP